MSSNPDVVYIVRDEAFFTTAALADHILENANSYHALAEADKFPGRDRMAFSIMLTMFDEMGKLLHMVRECEKTAKADHPDVRVVDFHNNSLNGRRGLGQILEEIRTIESICKPWIFKGCNYRRTGISERRLLIIRWQIQIFPD